MTTTTANTSEETSREIHRQVCAYLKGYIVGYAKRRGMKWEGDQTRTEEFKKGFEDSERCDDSVVTVAHIIYNRVRHNRPHCKTEKLDDKFLREHSWKCNKLINAVAEMGYPVKGVL